MTASNHELRVLSPERALLFLHRGTGRAAGTIAHRAHSRIARYFPQGQAGPSVLCELALQAIGQVRA
jgi:hypothetical protein